MEKSPKKESEVYSLSGIPGVGKTTRGVHLEKVYGWKFYPEPTHEWPLDVFYATKERYAAGNATAEDMMDATNYLQLCVGISYLNLGKEILEFKRANPGVQVIVERSPKDTTLFLRTNIIPANLRDIQIKQYEALKKFMDAYDNIEPWCSVHHIFLRCEIDVTLERLLMRDETRITREYLERLHAVHTETFPQKTNDTNAENGVLCDFETADPTSLKSSAYIGYESAYSVIDISTTGVDETCQLICAIAAVRASE